MRCCMAAARAFSEGSLSSSSARMHTSSTPFSTSRNGCSTAWDVDMPSCKRAARHGPAEQVALWGLALVPDRQRVIEAFPSSCAKIVWQSLAASSAQVQVTAPKTRVSCEFARTNSHESRAYHQVSVAFLMCCWPAKREMQQCCVDLAGCRDPTCLVFGMGSLHVPQVAVSLIFRTSWSSCQMIVQPDLLG